MSWLQATLEQSVHGGHSLQHVLKVRQLVSLATSSPHATTLGVCALLSLSGVEQD